MTYVKQLLTGYNQLMLAEFKYGLEPKETFSDFFDQAKPNRSALTSCHCENDTDKGAQILLSSQKGMC